MRRREFIAGLGAAAAWPMVARAQQTAPTVGLIAGYTETEMRPLAAAFRARMREHGWNEGSNIAIEVRTSAGDFTKLDSDARTFVEKGAAVIVAMGTPGLTAAKRHTSTLPIVFTQVADPVGQRLIDNLAHPGGNATGLTNFEFSIAGKWLELLKDMDSRIRRVTAISNPANPSATPLSQFIESSGRVMSIEVTTTPVRNARDIENTISSMAGQHDSGLVVLPDSLAVVHTEAIVGLAARHNVPAVYPFRSFAEKGGLITYGLDINNMYRQAADYTNSILRGTKPSDLPVQAPNKFELVINLKTAKALGLTVPPTLLARADEVIE